jgi:transposase
LRVVLDGILYIARTGCQWRLLPKDFHDHDEGRGAARASCHLLLKIRVERFPAANEPGAVVISAE